MKDRVGKSEVPRALQAVSEVVIQGDLACRPQDTIEHMLVMLVVDSRCTVIQVNTAHPLPLSSDPLGHRELLRVFPKHVFSVSSEM